MINECSYCGNHKANKSENCTACEVGERDYQITSLRADLAAARAQIEALTKDLETLTHECLVAHEKVSLAMIEEQKWRDSFFAVVAKRDAMRLALSAVAGDPCDEPYMDGRAPCGCCRSHIKTARRALDEG